MRKLYAILILILFVSVSSLYSLPIKTGPFLSLKTGISGVNTPAGRANAFSFSSLPDFGLTTMFPLGRESNLELGLDLAYSSYSYNIEDSEFGDKYKHSYSYFVIGPHFRFEYFLFGFNIAFPMAGDMDGKIDKELMETNTELFVGGIITLFSDDTGDLNLVLRIGYMLGGIYDNFAVGDPLSGIIPVQPPQQAGNHYNPRPLSISLGFNYLLNFNI